MIAKKGRSATFYAKNKKSRDKKKAYDTKYHKTKLRKLYRAFLNRVNRRAGTYGNGDGKDYDHTEKKFMSARRNRGKDRPS
jgi:hypothetical protein|tara:strand:- start:168 stop:410 length:243 start_codon:yes stop_codon:yes gene_type:complete